MAEPRQLVTLPEWEAYKCVMSSKGFEIDSNDFPFVSLFYPKLSILFDDDKRQISYFKKYHVSCTTIVVKPPEKNVPASVFCTIDVLKNSELSEDIFKIKREFFKRLGIHYYVFTEDQPNQLHYFNGSDPLFIGSIIKLDSGSFNYWQFQSIASFFVENISEYVEKFNIVHEPSLDMIMSIGIEDNKILNEINLYIDKMGLGDSVNNNFFKNTSVDAVFCVDMPYGIPLFAIEYDGSTHKTNKQINKDKVKDLIFEKAGIPLIRVKTDYLKPGSQDWEVKCKINREVTRQLLRAELNLKDYASRMLRYLNNEADNIKNINQSASFNMITLINKMNLFLSRRYNEIKRLKKTERDYYKDNPDFEEEHEQREREYQSEIEEGSKYGVPVKISKATRSGAIIIDVKIEPKDEAYKSVGGKIFGFILGPYKIDDATGFYQFDSLIERMLREEALRRLDEIFLSGDPSLKDKMAFYRISKIWKNFEYKHNSRVRWWLGSFFFESLMEKYTTGITSISLNDFYYKNPPCKIIEQRLRGLQNPLLDVSIQQKDVVAQDLSRLKDLLAQDGAISLFVRAIKIKELEECRNLVRSLVSELVAPNHDFSIFEILQNKDVLISVLEGAKEKAKENEVRRLKETHKIICYRVKARHEKEIEKIDRAYKIIKKRLLIVDVLADPPDSMSN